MIKPNVMAFFDESTNTASYVVADPTSDACAIIDSVLDYDASSGRTAQASADDVINYVASNNLDVKWILETHVHADHLSAAPLLKDRVGGKIGIGNAITDVQQIFGAVFSAGSDFDTDGNQFDHLFGDDEHFSIGNLECRAMHTPGHTPACMTYLVGDAAFVGDTLFMPDYGTARADFPGGNSRSLYRSIQKIFRLPPDTRLFMCHDYKPPGRDEFQWETTVADERANNIHVRDGVSEEEFVKLRDARDKTLGMPKLILPSVQVNMRAGNLPPADETGKRFLKIPVNEL